MTYQSEAIQHKRGDTSPTYTYQLTPDTVDINNATVVAKMRTKSDHRTIFNDRACAITSAAAPATVQFSFIADDVSETGEYELEFEVTYSDLSIETFPADGWIPVTIVENIQ